jgi:methionyl-tRNA synthetase
MSSEKILIGVAWPYANGPLHLGHVAGSLLPPDIFARYHRMKGDRVLMVSGSDEHGTPITLKAESEGISPQELVDRYHKEQVDSINGLGISFDLFWRTSSPNHKRRVQEIFKRIYENGYITEKEIIANYCPTCNRYLPDRYVEGTCPACGFQGAKGDQCESCGLILDLDELIDPRCKLCGTRPIKRETKHLFLRLSALKPQLEDYARSKKGVWRKNVYDLTMNWLRDLRDRPVTRDIDWGVEVPVEGYEEKRIYVWFDAVLGYYTTSVEYGEKVGEKELWKDFWEGDSRSFYFVGKDNIPFHSIIFPAILLAFGGLNLPYDIPANEYLLFKGEQFSKSRNVGVLLGDFLKIYDPDAIRYYLTINAPEGKDTDFSLDDFIIRNDEELVSVYGNFVYRTLSLAHRNWGFVPDGTDELKTVVESYWEKVGDLIEARRFSLALREGMALAKEGNRYLNENEPWRTIKDDREDAGRAIHNSLRLVRSLSVIMQPFLPFSSQRIWGMLGCEGSIEKVAWQEALKDVEPGAPLNKPQMPFRKIGN